MERPLRHGCIALLVLVALNLIPNTQSRSLLRPKRELGANLYLPGSHVIPGGEGSSSGWGEWGAPSPCSRTCGGGVSHQTRECQSIDGDGRSLCSGGNKRFFSCNTQDCPEGEVDFRQQQCSEFNSVAFENVFYKWVPYRKAPNPCELNCMPEGERFYYRHKASVVDGTRCNEENLDVCVNGGCEKVGCDMMLGSNSKEDKCRRCEGDGSACRTVNGTLDMSTMQVGYNDILLIPAGATNIQIREISPSNNYLAIRNLLGSYYLNGNWRIDFPSPKKFTGAIWHYDRKPQGFAAPDLLTCLGPTTEAVYVVLLSQDVNVGIEYEYSVLENLVKQSQVDTYYWTFNAYTECSSKCGGGFQTRKVTCNSRLTLEEVEEGLCDGTERPDDARQCGHESCPPHWSDSTWGKCSAVCGTEGKQEREVKCEQVSEDGNVTVVKDSVCLDSVGNKPATEQECNRGVVCPEWYTSDWSSCSKLCGAGSQKREVICYRKEQGKVVVLEKGDCPGEEPEATRECTIRPCKGVDWITSSWSGCKSCGLATETRTAMCASKDGTIFNDTFCENHAKPELQRPCETQTNCEFQWFTSQWSKCSAECGKGVQSRVIVCGSFDGEMVRAKDESSCDAESKPEATRDCDGPAECPGQWFSGPWSDCSAKCGGGQKTRKILCMVDQKVADSKKCDEETIEFGAEDCNEEPCVDDETLPVDVTSRAVTEDADEGEDYCDEDEEDDVLLGGRFGASMEDEQDGVTMADVTMDSSSDGFELDETTQTESSMMTDEVMMSDSTGFETVSTVSDSMTSFTPEGSGSTMFSEGSGDDDDLTTVSSDDIAQSTVESVTGSSVSDGVTESVTDRSTSVSEDIMASSVSQLSSQGVTEVSDSESTTESVSATSSADSTTEAASDSTTMESDTTSDSTSESTYETSTMDSTTDSASDSTINSQSEFTTDSEMTTESVTETSADGATTLTSDLFTTTESVTEEASGSTMDSEGTTAESVTEGSDMTSSDVSGETTVAPSESSPETTEAGTTDASGATNASDATEATEATGFTDGSDGTTESPRLDARFGDDSTGTDIDIWTTTPSGDDEEATTSNILSGILAMEQKPRKCKPRPKIEKCTTSKYGCCPDNSSEATGPFDEGCPIPETCKDTKHGCCADEVTPAKGPKNRGCPKEDCKKTLFGCCPDKKTPSKGNNNEGCPVEPEKPKGCAASKFGCCPDGKTDAKGKKNKGCKEEEKPKEDKKEEDGTQEPDIGSRIGDDEGKTKGCAESEFGCCPDGKTEATGKDFKGCDSSSIINQDDCTKSHFGCCPDNRTAATDSNQGGCSECGNEIFGCCPDGVTPAHGPNREGCCLDSEFGCCPDNIQAASGPALEGCGCEITQFGCCPDGSSTAVGPNNAGCGCQYAEHGCCPDKSTEARGPNHEGCGCETYQFGCCPDGVTVPKGPSNYGCYCAHSEFKCCPDGVTHAKGPNFEGCSCMQSEHGCCPDGTTSAQGKNFEGCENVPLSPQMDCSLKKDSGPGKNYSVKFFYDNEYGACSRFWYGGEEGNNNRFDTLNECQDVCENPTGKEACLLPKVQGPCGGYEPMWHYDDSHKQCVQFVYSGCLGNNNRFPTREACEGQCAAGQSLPVCSQPAEEGPCSGNFERWHFDEEAKECRPFRYGGCKGNKNNFESEAACKYGCQKPGIHTEKCTEPKEVGKCDAKQARWAFSSSDNKCMPFYFTGCEGNSNNYRTEEECQASCPATKVKNACELPADLGPCQNYTARWYWNTAESRCRQFYYGGCEGNGNNFEEEHQCKAECDRPQETPQIPSRIDPGTHREPDRPSQFNANSCQLEPDAGHGDRSGRRYHYSRHYGICTEFLYNGEGGNENNFQNHEECIEKCERVQDTCTLPSFAGPCDDMVDRWFYEPLARRCEQFKYGNCLGNRNNFESENDCMSHCHRDDEPEEPQSVSICEAPRHPGDGNTREVKFFFNRDTATCEAFTYTGAGGNGNRFETKEQCERQCGEYRGEDVCSQPMDVGPCDQWQTLFYYDVATKKCEPFSYGGCEGSGNRFSSEQECQSICVSREEPATDSREICMLGAESGRCQQGNDPHRRWYYDDLRGNCVTFIYNGCGGNQNNFRSYEDCIGFCRPRQQVDVRPVQPEVSVNEQNCDEHTQNCERINCQYDIDTSYNEEGCRVCTCSHPCKDKDCGQGSVCAVDYEFDPESGTNFVAVCRQQLKAGECPRLGNTTTCARDCYEDSDCRGEKKCCQAGCGFVCADPATDRHVEPSHPVPTEVGSYAPVLEERSSEELNVKNAEGGHAILRCFATGYPPPTVTWHRHGIILNTDQGRYGITTDGDLQIVQLHRTDSGTYVCVADNGLGKVEREVALEVSDPEPVDAYIVGPLNETKVVTLNQPATLRCLAGGYPKPSVTWWQGTNMIPLRSDVYEYNRDLSLTIRHVQLVHLGPYACQAYTGHGKGVSYSVTVQAIGPVHTDVEEEKPYLQYLIDAPTSPTTQRPQVGVPYRPPVLPPRYIPKPPQRTIVPVTARLNLSNGQEVGIGAEINIKCEVDGYPSPNITWYFNDQELHSSIGRIQIVENEERLIVRGATPEDSGEYKCLARNEYSHASHTEQIVVQGVHVPSHCVDNPFFADCSKIVRGQYCKHVYYAKFCCRSCTLAGQLSPAAKL